MEKISILCKSLNVASVSYAPLKSGALVFGEGTSFHIILNNQLSDAKSTFALLHELGHLALGIIHQDPIANHCTEQELKVNYWAINAFSKLYPRISKDHLKRAFQRSEHDGYEEVERLVKKFNVKIEERYELR